MPAFCPNCRPPEGVVKLDCGCSGVQRQAEFIVLKIPYIWQYYTKARTDCLFDFTDEDEMICSIIGNKPNNNLNNGMDNLLKTT